MSLTTKARRSVAALATGALLGATVVAMAPVANAAPVAASNVSTSWGIKSSWRNYIAEELGKVPSYPQERASISVSDGAAFAGTINSTRQPVVNKAPYTWTAGATSVEPTTGAVSAGFAGRVTFAYPNHYIHSLTIANPRVAFNTLGSGTLYADIDYDTGGGGGEPVKKQTLLGAALGVFTNAPTLRSLPGGGTQVTLTAAPQLTAAGSAAVNGFWLPGDSLDPITVRFDVDASMSQTTVSPSPSKVAYGTARSVKVAVAGSSTGNVTLLDGTKSLGTKALSGGATTFTLSKKLSVGTHALTATFTGAGKTLPSQGVATLKVTKAKAKSTLKLSKKQKKKAKAGKRAKLRVKVTARGVTPKGKVVIKDGKKKVRTVKLKKGKASVKLPRLKNGKHRLTVTYKGTKNITKDTSKKLKIKVKK